MARGRPRRTSRDVLLKSAEFIGWALGGLEREIAQTRERLAALTAQAHKLREKVGIVCAVAGVGGPSPTSPSIVRRGAQAHLGRDEAPLGRAQERKEVEKRPGSERV